MVELPIISSDRLNIAAFDVIRELGIKIEGDVYDEAGNFTSSFNEQVNGITQAYIDFFALQYVFNFGMTGDLMIELMTMNVLQDGSIESARAPTYITKNYSEEEALPVDGTENINYMGDPVAIEPNMSVQTVRPVEHWGRKNSNSRVPKGPGRAQKLRGKAENVQTSVRSGDPGF